jgi:hypothetical protein
LKSFEWMVTPCHLMAQERQSFSEQFTLKISIADWLVQYPDFRF